MNILNEYEQDGMVVKEYTRDGKTVSHITKTPIQKESEETEQEEMTVEDKVNYLYYKEMGLFD